MASGRHPTNKKRAALPETESSLRLVVESGHLCASPQLRQVVVTVATIAQPGLGDRWLAQSP